MSSKITHTQEESLEQSVECEASKSESCSSWGAGCGDSGLWIAVAVLVILWTIGVWAGWSWCAGAGNSDRSGKCDGGFGSGALVGGLLWLIILVIFLAAAYRCGWGAVVGFLVFLLIVLLIGWWWWSASC